MKHRRHKKPTPQQEELERLQVAWDELAFLIDVSVQQFNRHSRKPTDANRNLLFHTLKKMELERIRLCKFYYDPPQEYAI